MPRPRWHRLAPEKQQAILDAATAEFSEHGLSAASYNRIIASVGVSKGAMYYYFEDKEDLFVTVIRARMGPMAELLALPESVEGPEAFWSLLDHQVGDSLAILLSDPTLAALGRALYESRNLTSGGAIQELLDETAVFVGAALDLGQRAGAIRADLPRDLLAAVTFAMLLAMDRWFAEAWEQLDPNELPALTYRSMGLVRDLLSPRPPGADAAGG